MQSGQVRRGTYLFQDIALRTKVSMQRKHGIDHIWYGSKPIFMYMTAVSAVSVNTYTEDTAVFSQAIILGGMC